MDYLDPALGIPLQQPYDVQDHNWQQQAAAAGFGPVMGQDPFGQQQFDGGAPPPNADRPRAGRRDRRPSLGARNRAGPARNANPYLDELLTGGTFWASVFQNLVNNPNVAEDIRRDVEQEERRLAEVQERRRRRRENETRRRGDDAEDQQQRRRGGDDFQDERLGQERGPQEDAGTDGYESDGGVALGDEDLPDLYGVLSGHVESNTWANAGTQHLGLLLDELDIESLWSARDVTITFGQLAHILLRLLSGSYETQEERLIVRMLNIGVQRASSMNGAGFTDSRSRQQQAEPFSVVYRRRGRVLRDFAAFRYMLEITETMGRISHRHKNNLILLYLTLTTPEVRLHRGRSAEDRENTFAFRDIVTGQTITTPPIMARPMSIEMHLDSVFGNVSINARLLERSLLAALNNRNRKTNAARDIETLLENSNLLDAADGDTNAMRTALKPFRIEREHASLRHMLEMSTVVSMMAEEYRVFVAGAPPSRGGGGGANGKSTNASKRHPGTRQSYVFRRPIFLTFKPVTRAAAQVTDT